MVTATARIVLGAVTLTLVQVASAAAQNRGVDVSYGRWLPGSGAVSYSATYYRPVVGPLDYGLGVSRLEDLDVADNRSLTAGEVSLGIGRDGHGAHLVGALGLGIRHRDRNFDAYWSAGGGYSVRLLKVLSVGIEARYRVEDRRTRGFWRLDQADRRGLMLQGRVALSFGSGNRGTRVPTAAPVRSNSAGRIPIPAPLSTRAMGSADGIDLMRSEVVETALAAMGTPYRWGGTDENGFDCSGLIQYAYGENGVIIPRTSRAQARTGIDVDRDPAMLEAGDILGFALEGSGVSHVGLYVGDGQFIHSATGGVRLSELSTSDPEGRYWLERWSSVSRVLN